MIRNPDDKELNYRYFQPFWSGGEDNTSWKKVQPDPMLIFLSGNRSLYSSRAAVYRSYLNKLKKISEKQFFRPH